MKKYLFDTNIIISLLKRRAFVSFLSERYQFRRNSTNTFMISAVTVGELQAMIARNNWGYKRQQDLERVLGRIARHTHCTTRHF